MPAPEQATRFGPSYGVAILGTGAAFPTDIDPSCPVLTTTEAVAALGAPPSPQADAWGVTSRQWVGLPSEKAKVTLEDLATHAAKVALAEARLTEVDMVHVATSTPSAISASLAARIALRLGLSCLTADVRGGGAGAILAWVEALGMMRIGARTALVIGVEVISPYLTAGDATGSLWGDAAGAIVLGAGPGAGGLEVALAGTTKLEGRSFTVPGALPPTPGADYRFRTPDRVYKEGLRGVRLGAAKALRSAAPAPDVALAYGATSDQVVELGDAIGAPVVSTLDRTGCVGTAAIPVALHALRRTAPNDAGPSRIGAVAAGGGAVWASMIWSHSPIPI